MRRNLKPDARRHMAWEHFEHWQHPSSTPSKSISWSGHASFFDILSMPVSGRESPVQSLPSHSVTHQSSETAGLKVLLPSLQVLSMTLTKKLRVFKIPSLLYRNLVINVHLYLSLWPKHYLCATLCPTTNEISKRQSSNLFMLYCYHFPSRGTPFQLSFPSRRPFFIARVNQSCPETSRAA